ncbi:MAG: MFS transporter [Candidatus Nanopelagicales bacterium]
MFGANSLSNIGTWAQRVAQDWLVLELTGSAALLGIVTGLQFAPSLVMSIYGGKLADQFSKRKLILWTSAGSGVSAGLLGVLVVTEQIQTWHVLVLAFSLGLFSSTEAPIRQSFTSELVGEKDLPNAVGLNSANFNAGRLIGPAFAGFTIAAFGTGPAFLLNACSYVVVIVTLLFLREDELHRQEKLEGPNSVREAFDYILNSYELRNIFIFIFLFSNFALHFQLFNALMATKEFGLSAAGFGSLGSIFAIGSITGALLAARLNQDKRYERVMKLASVMGIALMVLSFAPSFLIYAALLPIMGTLGLTIMISANSFVQTTTPPALRGRVIGLYLSVFIGSGAFSSPAMGWFCGLIGVRTAIVVAGAVTFLTPIGIHALSSRRMNAAN